MKMSPKKIWLIAKRELGSFFHTPFSMLVLTFFCVLVGIFFYTRFDGYMQYAYPTDPTLRAIGLTVYGNLLTPFFGDLINIFLMIIPLVTMRTYAEEKKIGTYDLLVSYPLSPGEVVFGKYFGSFFLVAFLLLFTLPGVIFVCFTADVYFPQIFSAYAGLFMLTLLFTAIGMFASIQTQNQFIAAVISYAITFSTFIIGWLAFISPTPLDRIFSSFLLVQHQTSFRNGLIYVGDIVAFISLTLLFLLLTLSKYRKHFIR